jgi:transcriptional regulator with XRE-family HTH domain
MPKPKDRPYSRYAQEAALLLGRLVRQGRVEHGLTAQAFATRAGVSRALLHRIETGDPGCAVGAVFEAAVLAGVPLFAETRGQVSAEIARVEDRLRLLPQTVRPRKAAVDDDF